MKESQRAAPKIAKARAAGCQRAVTAWREAKRANIPYWVLCAFLEQESSGGKNVFGHDTMKCSEDIMGQRVTKRRYEEYKRKRDTCGRQGVGPMQLTWHSFQDEADALGGCWKPQINIRYGARLLADYHKESGSWHDVAKRYNGSEEYADRNDEFRAKWRTLLAEADEEEEKPKAADDRAERNALRGLARCRSVKAVGEWLGRCGLTPAENIHFNGVDPVHSETSLHYQKTKKGNFAPDKQGNLALDVNDHGVVDTAFYRVRRGEWRFWKPQSEQEALRYAFKKLKTVARKKGWPMDEMFFDGMGYRIETGWDQNTPIDGHDTHLHVGFQSFQW